jgi:hypothetical protein
MGNIPYESRIDARSGRSNGPRLRNAYSAEDFGAGAGRAMQQAGAQTMDLGDTLRQERQKKEQEQALYGEAMFDPSSALDAVRGNVNQDAEGYKETVRTTYVNTVEEYLNGFEDDNVRKELRERLMNRLPAYTAQAQAYQVKAQEEASKERTNQVLNRVQNDVLSNPGSYDMAKAMGEESIDLYGPADGPMKAAMKNQFNYDLTKKRFEGRLNSAKTAADLDAVAEEMQRPEWQGSLMPRDYEDITGKIVTAKRAYQQQVKSEGSAALKSLEERAKDPMNPIAQEELVQAQDMVKASGDISYQQRLARVVRDQQIVRSERRLTPAQMRQRIEDTKNVDPAKSAGGLPPTIASYVNDTATKFGVTASYLDSTISREFGGELAKPQPDFGKKADTSSATGLLQFTDKTFLNLMKDPTTQTAMGVDTSKMTEQQILDLRKDPQKSVIAGAILAKQNKSQMEASLGRSVSDAELYMAHFLGAPEATRFLQLTEANSGAIASQAFPEAAAANKNVFQAKDGRQYTVAEVYSNIANSFTASTTQVAYDDNQVREKMLTSMEQALNGPDGIKYAAQVGVISLTPLDQEGGFASRGKALETASTYYGRKLQPFTTDEEAYIQKKITDGTVDDTLGMMASIQSMGPSAARAAFDQLKVKSPAFAHAGSLALNGDPAVASDIVRGYKRMKENPAILTGLAYKEEEATTQFEKTVGGALSRISPSERQAAQEAALAYLVETDGAAGKKYSSSSYQNAVNKVLGGRIDKLNGEKTYLPAGIQARDMRKALSLMTLQDYIALSVNGSTPQHADGTAIDPRDMEDEVVLRAIGDDKYALADGEGAFLWTGKVTPEGYPEKFVVDLKPDRIRNILDRRMMAMAGGR